VHIPTSYVSTKSFQGKLTFYVAYVKMKKIRAAVVYMRAAVYSRMAGQRRHGGRHPAMAQLMMGGSVLEHVAKRVHRGVSRQTLGGSAAPSVFPTLWRVDNGVPCSRGCQAGGGAVVVASVFWVRWIFGGGGRVPGAAMLGTTQRR
jgi:hypothetical protein